MNKDHIKSELTDRAEELFRQFWGEPQRAGSHDWRVKGSSSRSMKMRGPKRGMWKVHSGEEKGDILDFVAIEICGISKAAGRSNEFNRVLRAAAEWAGISDTDDIDHNAIAQKRLERENKAEAEQAAEDRRKALIVSQIANKVQPIEGTPAAAYLASRGITMLPAGALGYLPPAPTVQMWHNTKPALLVWGADERGHKTGGQRIIIDQQGKRPQLDKDDPSKPFFGQQGGNPARFPARIEGPLCVVEGPESALSVWQATGFETWAVFGVNGFEPAPLPQGRKVILCPDRDPPVGTYPTGSKDAENKEKAARAFKKAQRHHKAAGVDLWIAEAPEPTGSKNDLNDTLQRAGNAAVLQAIESATPAPENPPEPPRSKNGRFKGKGTFPFTGTIPNVETPLPLEQARMKVGRDIAEALAEFSEWNGEGTAPCIAIKADPGLGKSTMTRDLIAKGYRSRTIAGDVTFHLPTTALAVEAENHMATLQDNNAMMRGRLATLPGTTSKMCNRPEAVERAGNAGLPIGPSLCKTRNDKGEDIACPFYDTCAYQQQIRDLEGPAARFMAHAYLNYPDPAGDREIVFQVIDESFFKAQAGSSTVYLDRLQDARSIGTVRAKTQSDHKRIEAERYGTINDLLLCAGDLVRALGQGKSVMEAVAEYTAEELHQFKKAEMWGSRMAEIMPDSSDDKISATLSKIEAGQDRAASARAAFWRTLAETKEAGEDETQRIEYVPNYVAGNNEPRAAIRVFWRKELAQNIPTLILDADADETILQEFFPSVKIKTTRVQINAHVTQVIDHVFGKGKLTQKKKTRKEWAEALNVEASKDAGGGLLAVATKAAVRAFFDDAGLIPSDATDEQINEIMRTTKLHGAKWAWFGPSTLGSNEWQDFTTVVIIGREEWPVNAYEELGRSIYGNGLDFLQPDDAGKTLMPEIETPLMFSDGTVKGVLASSHPDLKIAALQRQARASATRQAVERLRLANAKTPKRVILGSSVPIPGLPVDVAMTWEEYKLTRLHLALIEAEGALRLSPKGLAADAPQQFPTQNSAKEHLKQGDQVKGFFGGLTGNNILLPGGPPKDAVLVQFKIKGVQGRHFTRAIVFGTVETVEQIARDKWGDLVGFEVLKVLNTPEKRPDMREATPEPLRSPSNFLDFNNAPIQLSDHTPAFWIDCGPPDVEIEPPPKVSSSGAA